MKEISRFILFIGPISSIFDYVTYAVMLFVFKCWWSGNQSLFQTGWFVESLLTQTLIIHIIRTNRIPFIQSRASWPLIFTTLTIVSIGLWLPFSFFRHSLGFVRLPPLYFAILFGILLGYTILTQTVKSWLLKKAWI